MGFVKKGSKASLIAGASCGAVYAYLAYAMSQQPTVGNGSSQTNSQIAAGVSALLAVAMGVRAVKADFARVPTIVAALGGVSAAAFLLL
jgi:uncharacterized membrane protein (UPF0136 family)